MCQVLIGISYQATRSMIAKLEMLIALAQERHFGRAAEALGITQPTLSAGIKQLEDHLGVKLVERGSRFGGLTTEGQRALVMARKIVGDSRRLRDEMQAKRDGLTGQIRLGVIPTALTWAADLATQMTRQHPGVSLSITSTTSQNIKSLLDNLEIDAGITYLDNEPIGRVSTVELYRETYHLVCHQAHALARNDHVTWDQIATQTLCLLTPDMQNRRIINRNFHAIGADPVARIVSNSTVVLAATVAGGDWVTILPGDMATFLAQTGPLTAIPIRDTQTAHVVGLVTEYQEPHTPVLSALMQTAAQFARN